jgi:hypothetical protein
MRKLPVSSDTKFICNKLWLDSYALIEKTSSFLINLKSSAMPPPKRAKPTGVIDHSRKTFTPPATFRRLADTLLGETPPENKYRYTPLRSNNDEIRILILHKGKGVVEQH